MKKQDLKIRSLSIRNFKGIETLDIDFPPPKYQGDPDVFVLASGNGGGENVRFGGDYIMFGNGFRRGWKGSTSKYAQIFFAFPGSH